MLLAIDPAPPGHVFDAKAGWGVAHYQVPRVPETRGSYGRRRRSGRMVGSDHPWVLGRAIVGRPRTATVARVATTLEEKFHVTSVRTMYASAAKKRSDKDVPGLLEKPPIGVHGQPTAAAALLRRAPLRQELRPASHPFVACGVVHGDPGGAHCDGCAALAAVASRGSRLRRAPRARPRFRWPPELRPPSAPSPPIALRIMPSQYPTGRALCGARRLHSLPPSGFQVLSPASRSKNLFP